MSSVDLRPLSLGELLDRTFTLYRSHFWLFVGIMAVPHVINVALNLVLQGIVGPIFALPPGFDPQKAGVDPAAMAGKFFLGFLVIGVVAWVLYSLALGATTIALADVYFSRPATIRGTYRKVRRRLGGLMHVLFSVMVRFIGLVLLLSLGSAILFAVPAGIFGRSNPILMGVMGLVMFAVFFAGFALAIWFILRYGVAIPALLLENLKAREALKRSVWLTKGQRGRLFLTLVLMLLITYITILILQGPFWVAAALVAGKSGHIPAWLGSLSAVSAGLGGALSGPLLMIGFSLLYYDVRVRKEAFDLQMMMAALEPGGPPPETPPAVAGA